MTSKLLMFYSVFLPLYIEINQQTSGTPFDGNSFGIRETTEFTEFLNFKNLFSVCSVVKSCGFMSSPLFSYNFCHYMHISTIKNDICQGLFVYFTYIICMNTTYWCMMRIYNNVPIHIGIVSRLFGRLVEKFIGL